MKALTLLAALLTCGAVNAASLVTNGSFEEETGWSLVASGGCANIAGTVGVMGSGCVAGSTLQQNISGLTPSEAYTLSFKLGFLPSPSLELSFEIDPPEPTVSVKMGSSTLANLTPSNLAFIGEFNLFSYNFFAGNTTETLEFVHTVVRASESWLLDEVQIVEAQQQPAPVNSPAPLALLLAGGLALASRRVLSARQ